MNNNYSLHQLCVFDALAEGITSLNSLFLEKEEYKPNFNMPWHELDGRALFLSLAQMVQNQHACLHVHSSLLSDDAPERACFGLMIGLTAEGGQIWEEAFEVRWDRYFDYEPVDQDKVTTIGESVDIVVRALDAEHLSTLLQMISSASLSRIISIGSILSREGWEWSNWKTHQQYFEAIIQAKAIADDPYSATNILSPFIEKLRAGWKQRFPKIYQKPSNR